MRALILSARLRQLLNHLRDAKDAITANDLATTMNISVRTLYRDLDRLRLLGVGVAGKTGEGLRLHDPKGHEPIARDEIKVTVVATPKGHSMLASEPWIEIISRPDDSGTEISLIARNASVLARAVLRAAGEITVIHPSKIRRTVRRIAQSIAKAHKKKLPSAKKSTHAIAEKSA
jgi:predicted DNA-binding transcriptional regulator YafY